MSKPLSYVLIVSLLAVIGCSPDSLKPQRDASESSEDFGEIDIQQLQSRIDIGDIESYTHFWVHLDRESVSPFIENIEIFSKKEEMTKATLNVSTPYPKELWLQVSMETIKPFAGYAMALRVRVFLDGTVIEKFDFTYETLASKVIDSYRFEVLSKFDAIPETALVHAEATIIMFAQEAFNADALDSVELSPKNSVVVLSNPLRINFGT